MILAAVAVAQCVIPQAAQSRVWPLKSAQAAGANELWGQKTCAPSNPALHVRLGPSATPIFNSSMLAAGEVALSTFGVNYSSSSDLRSPYIRHESARCHQPKEENINWGTRDTGRPVDKVCG